MEDKAAFAGLDQSPERVVAQKQRLEQWSGGPDFSVVWRAAFKVLSEHEK